MASGPSTSGAAGLLGACVGDVEGFLRESLGRQPLLHRGDGPDGPLGSLLTVDDVDELLTARALRAPAYRLVQDGRTVPRSATTRSGRIGGVRVDDLPDVGRVLELVHGGATLVLQSLHRSWPPVTRLCREVEDRLAHPVQANAYLTPPGSRGLDVHHDTHDVLAVQLVGSKHWVVHEPAVPAALPSQRWSREIHEPGPVVLDTELHTGDCLYLPRGTPHAAESTDEVSLHLTVGIRTTTWFDVLHRVLDEAAAEERFRAGLPAGLADDADGLADALGPVLEEVGRWFATRDPHAIADHEVARFRDGRAPRLEGQLRRVLSLDAMEAGTKVRARPGVSVRWAITEDRLVLDLPDRVVDLPAAVEPELAHLLAGDAVRLRDLDGRLDAPGRVVLARRLVREGVIETVEAGTSDA